MKKIRTFLLLTLCCFTLLSCPPGHFYEFQYLGTTLPSESLDYKRLPYNDQTDLFVKVGFYDEFIQDKECGLAAVIKYDPSYDLQKDAIVQNVSSSLFGELQPKDSLAYTARVYNTSHTLIYNLVLNRKKEPKLLKRFKKDTITMILTNGKVLEFVYSPTN